MSELAKEITPVDIEKELTSSYLDYAMSVIIGRALPDVRDGLKPVHRRALYAMQVLNNDWNKPYKKSARVVGDIIGKYHPHGDVPAYEAIVRMAQPWSLRYPLVDGQGNFGSIDGDSPAAMRYTEVRMARIAHDLLAELEQETVDFVPNYDGTEQIPEILPAKVPNLLINGSSGIAVGMATNIPPHSLAEVIDGCLAYLDNSTITVEALMVVIPGPDFPTAAIINGRQGIEEAYRTGRGRMILRARTLIERDKQQRETIIVNELPYQVNKARLIEKIAELVKEKKIEGISALRDESDREGMRIVIEIKRDAVADIVLNNLYIQTALQSSFGINMVALHQGRPKLLSLKEILDAFLSHRREVVSRRTLYELRKARERAHILEGLAVALSNIDVMIQLIRQAPNAAEAKARLLEQHWALGDLETHWAAVDSTVVRADWVADHYGIQQGRYALTPQQAQAILDMRLHKLTGLEHEKLLNEYRSLLAQVAALLEILENIDGTLREELIAIRELYKDARRTEITGSAADLQISDLITPEEVVVTLSHCGYVKYQLLSDYDAQRRGGKGRSATPTKADDFIEQLLVVNTHDTLLCFSSRGRLYWLKVYQLPQASRGARGKPIVNLLPLETQERITAILPVKEYPADRFIFMATALGTVKKTALSAFSRPRSTGIIALGLNEGDELIGVDMTEGGDSIMLFSAHGKVVYFPEDQVRDMGRGATGVRGIRLADQDRVVSLIIPRHEGQILTVTANGFGKRTPLADYPIKSRATQGVFSIKVTQRNGTMIGAVQVEETDQIMLITDAGTLVRLRVSEVNSISRNTHGVTLIRTSTGERVAALQRIAEEDEEEEAVISER